MMKKETVITIVKAVITGIMAFLGALSGGGM